MATRKVKDAIDISTNEPIYFLGHAKATYMSDGTTVEDAINNIKNNSGGGNSTGSGAYSEVNHGTSDTTFTLTPNTFHIWGEVTFLNLGFESETEGIANEYLFQFTSGSEPTTLILPSIIKFNSDFTIEEDKIYQISILKGLGTVMSWENESQGVSGGNTY